MNKPIPNHPLVGTLHTYRADAPPYDPDTDTEPGRTILGNGWKVKVRAVFQNWNGIAGLDMLAVWVYATSTTTHVTPADLDLPPLTESASPSTTQCEVCSATHVVGEDCPNYGNGERHA